VSRLGGSGKPQNGFFPSSYWHPAKIICVNLLAIYCWWSAGLHVKESYQLVFPVAAYQSWNGTRIEGLGIEPDIRVPWSFEDAQRGRTLNLTVLLRSCAVRDPHYNWSKPQRLDRTGDYQRVSSAARISRVKYHPDFPRVRIKEFVRGNTVTVDQLESLRLVAPPEPMPEPLTPFRASSSKS
jgi:hypothetical protein